MNLTDLLVNNIKATNYDNYNKKNIVLACIVIYYVKNLGDDSFNIPLSMYNDIKKNIGIDEDFDLTELSNIFNGNNIGQLSKESDTFKALTYEDKLKIITCLFELNYHLPNKEKYRTFLINTAISLKCKETDFLNIYENYKEVRK